jgi:NAD(P)-dependent dehydrogenase (short-subunit alcohol dehydrogenase family)
MDKLLNGQVVIVTGGSGLLGAEFSRAITENGGIAVIADLEHKETIQKNTHNVVLDITSKESVDEAFDQVIKKYGRVDAVVNNAYPRNKNYGKEFFDVEYSDFCENISMNLGGYFLTSQVAAKYFQKQGYGNIINIASIYGVVAPRFEVYEESDMTMPVEYSVIKSGIIHLTKYMAKYFKGDNVRVNCLSPGGILNGQNELFIKRYNNLCLTKGMLEPEDIGGTLVYLLSNLSECVNGQNIIVDDGFVL